MVKESGEASQHPATRLTLENAAHDYDSEGSSFVLKLAVGDKAIRKAGGRRGGRLVPAQQ